jgi:hypothetical protein
MQAKLTFANTVEQFDAGDCDGGVVEVLEAEHGPGSGPDTPMILFDQIVQVFRRSQFGALPCLVFVWNFTRCSMRSGIAIKRDADRWAQLRAKRFAEKGLGRCYIPLRTQSEVDGIAIPVDGHGPSDTSRQHAMSDRSCVHSHSSASRSPEHISVPSA